MEFDQIYNTNLTCLFSGHLEKLGLKFAYYIICPRAEINDIIEYTKRFFTNEAQMANLDNSHFTNSRISIM